MLAILVGGGIHHARKAQHARIDAESGAGGYVWHQYRKLDGYYNGVRTLVAPVDYDSSNRYNKSAPPELSAEDRAVLPPKPPLDPVVFDPYPDYASHEYLRDHHPVAKCHLDAAETLSVPDVYVYPGLPQHLPVPFSGSHSELGIKDDVCFERFGRLGPYGYGRNATLDGSGPGTVSEHAGTGKIFSQLSYVNYSNVDWGAAQKHCVEKNKARFERGEKSNKQRVQKHAFLLRTWTGYEYSEWQMLSLRAMIAELALKSGGEYDVHFLVQVRNNSIPIWADEAVYRSTLEANVPREFWNLTTLWSEPQVAMYYPGPFRNNFANFAGSSVHGVYRSPHFALQWFSQQHPEYDFLYNWEMDIRYIGHYYEFLSKIGEWANKQPRKGLWERSRRFWFPKFHGDYKHFTKFVEKETAEVDVAKNDLDKNGPVPIWGPFQDFKHHGMLPPPNETIPPTTYQKDNYEWGVGEDADLITFNPIFDPSTTNWVFRNDMTGYSRSLPIPPRRVAIVTVSRLSKRLLGVMHKEVWRQKHTAFPEMFPATVCMHHGLKAVYVPHPVYFDRDWDLQHMDQALNHPKTEWASPFGWGENNMYGSSFYYSSSFSPALWRRWLGQKVEKEGGKQQEETGTGRMCLRGTLHHPMKREDDPVD